VRKPGLTSNGGIEGSFPIYDTSSHGVGEKKPLSTKDLSKLGKEREIARVHIKCSSRNKRDFDVNVVAANGTVVAQFKRSAGPSLFENRGQAVEMPVKVAILQEGREAPRFGEGTVEMKEIGSCTFNVSGHPRLTVYGDSLSGDDAVTSFEMTRPFCNFHSTMCCLGFLLFLPTFGIATCVSIGCSLKKPLKYDMQKTRSGGKSIDLSPLLVRGTDTHIDFNDLSLANGGVITPQVIASDKFSMLMYAIITACENVVEPPSNNSGGSSL